MRRNVIIHAGTIGIIVAMTAGLPSFGESLPPSRAKAQHIFPGRSVPAVPVAEWEDKRGMHVVHGRRAVNGAPSSAVHYEIKSLTYPTGTISVYTFHADRGGVLHAITTETELYILKGEAEVGIDGKPVQLKAGDAASQPTGVLRKVGKAEDAVVIAWTVGSTAKNPKPMVVRGEDVPAEMTGEWDADGKVIRTATTEETKQRAPKDARLLLSKRYEFDGNSIRVAHLYKGTSRAPALTTTDSLIYVSEGHLRFHEGTEVRDVTAGDFIHEESGLTHIWDMVDDGGFVTTSGYAPKAK